MFLAPLVFVHLVGYRGVVVFGACCTTLGCLLTRWTLEMNVGMVALTYGFLQGFGNMAVLSCYMMPML